MLDFTPLFEKWVSQYYENPEGIKRYLDFSPNAREIGRTVYQYYVRTKQIEPIETIERKEKERIWKAAKTRGLDHKESEKLAKTFYLFENVLNQKLT